MGLLTEIARRHPKAKRSLHPTNSVVAIGKNAEELLKEHHLSVYPSGDKSPFFKIIEKGGKVVGIGEPAKYSLSFVHCIEDIFEDRFPFLTRTKKVYAGRVVDTGGQEITVDTKAAHEHIGNRDVGKYLTNHFTKEEYQSFYKGGTEYFVVNSLKFYSKMETLTHKGITIYSC